MSKFANTESATPALTRQRPSLFSEIDPYFAAFMRQLLAPPADPWQQWLEQWEPGPEVTLQ